MPGKRKPALPLDVKGYQLASKERAERIRRNQLAQGTRGPISLEQATQTFLYAREQWEGLVACFEGVPRREIEQIAETLDRRYGAGRAVFAALEHILHHVYPVEELIE